MILARTSNPPKKEPPQARAWRNPPTFRRARALASGGGANQLPSRQKRFAQSVKYHRQFSKKVTLRVLIGCGPL